MRSSKNRIASAILLVLALPGIAPAQPVPPPPPPLLPATATCQCSCGPARVQLNGNSDESCRSFEGLDCNGNTIQDCKRIVEVADVEQGFLCTTNQPWIECFGKTIAKVQILPLSEGEKDRINTAVDRGAKEAASDLLTTAPSVSGTSTKKSFLPQFQLAAGLADFLDEDGKLVFGYNTPAWSWGRLSFEARPTKPEVFGKLLAAVPEAERATKKETAEKKLDAFDRVDFSVKLNFLGVNHNGSDDPSTIAQKLVFDENGEYRDKRLTALNETAKQKALALLPIPGGNVPVATDPARLAEEKKLDEAVAARKALDQAYVRYLNQINFTRLGQLLDQQPQVYINADFRDQDVLAGPESSYKVGLAWEMALGPNYNKLLKYLDECELSKIRTTATCFEAYLEKTEVVNDRKWRMALKANYENTDDYDSPLAGVTLHLDEAQSWVASFTLGGVLKFQEEAPPEAEALADSVVAGPPKKAARIEQARLDFEAKYEDVSGDATRQDRLNLTLTFSQRVNDDFSLELSAVWADEPQYRGTVDRELGALAGLRYKINRNS